MSKLESNTTAGPITLHLEGDPEDPSRVGIVARATITVRLGSPGHNWCHELRLQSPGVWDIDDDALAAGGSIPSGSWVLDWYGPQETGALLDLIRALGATKEEA
jgi:hypothetical protein